MDGRRLEQETRQYADEYISTAPFVYEYREAVNLLIMLPSPHLT